MQIQILCIGKIKDSWIASGIAEFEKRLQEFMENSRYVTVLETIRTTGKLEQETEEQLKAALTELLTEFGK